MMKAIGENNDAVTPVRVLFALPGLHRVNRGAEVAFEELARAMSALPGCQVTLIGSGPTRDGEPYRYLKASCIPREWFVRWPKTPYLRSHYAYEELTFAPCLLHVYRPQDYDVTMTCGYPYTNWVLRRRRYKGKRPAHVFVTQNGDWMVQARNWEFRHFGCDALICTNLEYYERHKCRWRSALIPNGVRPEVFSPGPPERAKFGIPATGIVVLMVSALIASKRVVEGIQAVSMLPGAYLVLAGNGELRADVERTGMALLPGRFRRIELPSDQMPALYRSADLFLHMSQEEPFGNVYLEALATGLPVVAHDRPVTRWIVEDQGALVDTSDLIAVASALRQAMDRRTEKEVLARRRLVTTRYSWSGVAASYHRFFMSLSDPEAQRGIVSAAGNALQESKTCHV